MIVLMSFSQFYTQRQLMTKNVDMSVKTPFMQQQKMLMYVFPLIFAGFGVNFPVGVLVYWLTTNVWTMGQQMYVIRQNPTPGSKAQAAFLERLLNHVTHAQKTRNRRELGVVKAIVAKGRERNEYERKFISGLTKAGLVAQADGSVMAGDGQTAVETIEGGTTTTPGGAAGAPRRQQPKRQSKAQRQSGGPTGAHQSPTKPVGEAKPSLDKTRDKQPGDAKPPQRSRAKTPTKQGDEGSSSVKSGSTNARQAKSGQRKGAQRPKHPSKK
jgi:YidC/Oxa1 family membrane protein insertase